MQAFDEEKHNIKNFFRENRIGIYTTLIIHLLVIIILLLYNLPALYKIEIPFILDFSKQEAQEAQMQKQERRENFEKELDKLLAPTSHNNLRNVAVDENEQILHDDRHTNPSEIYDEARQVQERLDAAKAKIQQQQGNDESPEVFAPATGGTEAYKGPSVLSYNLNGRKAMYLPVPVYQCKGGGDVTVFIEVDRQGYVVSTDISIPASSNNRCLHTAAKRAAQTSRFALDSKAPIRQQGYITYRFIAQ
jgi:outer membrane biosynthesis protein TonB